MTCQHLGDALLSRDAAARGLNPLRTWYHCRHQQHPKGPIVCRCNDSCGRGCPGYSEESDDTPAPVVPARFGHNRPLPMVAPARRKSSPPRSLADVLAIRRQRQATVSTGPLQPLARHRIEHLAGTAFNGSLIRYQDRLLLAYRDGWGGSQIHVAELDEHLSPVRSTVLVGLDHERVTVGREDPRLFVHQGKLHVAFAGVARPDGAIATSALYARLTDDLRVEQVHYPHLAGRNRNEKNWSFFSHNNELYCTYAIAPHHRILRVEGDRVVEAIETWNPARWTGGPLRGGASPVRVGDQYYHFFHGRVRTPRGVVYNLGCYTFEARPPFRVLRSTVYPLLVADLETRPKPDSYAVLFTCGAVLDGNRWRISAGIHDSWIEVIDLDLLPVQARLEPVTQVSAG
jgi:predicted GH43/DUF377 family glycosyl hydrolase